MTMYKTRAVVITPLGYKILRAVEKGTYKFAKAKRTIRAGSRMRKVRGKLRMIGA